MTIKNIHNSYRYVKPAYVDIYDNESVWSKIVADIRTARYRIVLQATTNESALIAKQLQLLSECRERGVEICFLLQPPDSFRGIKIPPFSNFHTFVFSLKEHGAHVSFRREIRSLLLLVDDRCLWVSDEKDNFASVKSTEPSVSRFSNIETINDAVKRHNLNGCSDCISMREKCYAMGDPDLLLQALKAHRSHMGMTQAEVANSSGFTQSWISKVESGKRRGVSVEALSILTSACNTTLVLVPNFMMPLILKHLSEYLDNHNHYSNI